MFRHLAGLLVVTLVLGSCRLLACGLDCIDDRRVAAEASCHQDPAAPDTVLSGGVAHPCPPEAVETPVTLAQKSSAAFERATVGSSGATPTVPAIANSSQATHPPPARCPASRARATNVLRI